MISPICFVLACFLTIIFLYLCCQDFGLRGPYKKLPVAAERKLFSISERRQFDCTVNAVSIGTGSGLSYAFCLLDSYG
jgi:hypothetical protein